MSTSISPTSRNCVSVAAVPLMNARERPQRHAGMARDAKFDLLHAVRAAFGQRHERDLEAAARHRQFLHARRDGCAQRFRRFRARLGQHLCLRGVGFFRLGFGGAQRIEIGGGVEPGELLSALLMLLWQGFRLQPEFTGGRMQRVACFTC